MTEEARAPVFGGKAVQYMRRSTEAPDLFVYTRTPKCALFGSWRPGTLQTIGCSTWNIFGKHVTLNFGSVVNNPAAFDRLMAEAPSQRSRLDKRQIKRG